MASLLVLLLLGALTHACLGQIDYDYTSLIGLSNTFYKIQRQGRLPDNDVPWRGDTFLDDGQDIGVDLSGGHFDAGDFVKFMFPYAGFTTIINWGIIDFPTGYEASVLSGALETVRTSLNFLLKTHPQANTIHAQMGNGTLDHSWWGRPEDWPYGPRPTYTITESRPGSELGSEYAAAFASGYLVFKERDPAFAATMLQHARQAYNFAYTYRGKYSDSVPEAADFYNSWSGYGDDLGYGALWMYRATNDSQYRTFADILWNEFGYAGSNAQQFSWDDKYAGIFVLGLRLTGEEKYRAKAIQFCDNTVNTALRTPKGLVFLGEWGPLRYASNAVYICLQLADLGVNAATYRAFARQQIGYILGDTGRSFVVGFGINPPRFSHHRPSSCPPRPQVCDWNLYNGNQPNYYDVTGAIVGGPDANDVYEDSRQLWQHTEVGLDYNAAYQSNLAALHSLRKAGLLH